MPIDPHVEIETSSRALIEERRRIRKDIGLAVLPKGTKAYDDRLAAIKAGLLPKLSHHAARSALCCMDDDPGSVFPTDSPQYQGRWQRYVAGAAQMWGISKAQLDHTIAMMLSDGMAKLP